MTTIIISIILTLLTVLSLSVVEKDDTFKLKFTKRSLFGFLWLGLILFNCSVFVGVNKVGIVYNPFKNGIQRYTLSEGFSTKNPLTKVYQINTDVKELSFENISVQTNDAQFVNTTFKVQAKIDPNSAFEYFSKYKNKSLNNISSVISSTIQKQLESVTTQYNIMDVLGAKRDEIVNKTLELIKVELAKDGINVLRITLVDTDAGDAIEAAIANEAVAKKEAETAEYKKQKAELEGDAKVVAAKKEKEANELINTTLTKELLMEKLIEKWDGKLPETYAGQDITALFGLK